MSSQPPYKILRPWSSPRPSDRWMKRFEDSETERKDRAANASRRPRPIENRVLPSAAEIDHETDELLSAIMTGGAIAIGTDIDGRGPETDDRAPEADDDLDDLLAFLPLQPVTEVHTRSAARGRFDTPPAAKSAPVDPATWEPPSVSLRPGVAEESRPLAAPAPIEPRPYTVLPSSDTGAAKARRAHSTARATIGALALWVASLVILAAGLEGLLRLCALLPPYYVAMALAVAGGVFLLATLPLLGRIAKARALLLPLAWGALLVAAWLPRLVVPTGVTRGADLEVHTVIALAESFWSSNLLTSRELAAFAAEAIFLLVLVMIGRSRR